MKPSKLLRKAAMELEKSHNTEKIKDGCCAHILYADIRGFTHAVYEAKSYFYLYMAPDENRSIKYWYGNPDVTPRTNERVLALLFASAIAESEGK